MRNPDTPKGVYLNLQMVERRRKAYDTEWKWWQIHMDSDLSSAKEEEGILSDYL